MLPLAMTLVGLLLAAPRVAEAFPVSIREFVPWFGVIVAGAGALLQYTASQPYVWLFAKSDWKAVDQEFVLAISEKRHRRGAAATVTVQVLARGAYEDCGCDVRGPDALGDVILGANFAFDGRVIVR